MLTCKRHYTWYTLQLLLGWKTWKELGSSSMDHNMRFLCNGARSLSEGRLSLHHSGQCLVWDDHPDHAWDQYMSLYVAGVDKRYLQKRKQ